MSSAPITMEWNGEAMVPASPYWSARADRQFVVGEVYNIVEHHDRSKASHNHYFVSLSNAWETLPDELLEIYPSAEHLRKKALIRKGYCNERDIVLSTKADAKSIARELQHLDTYAIIEARECVDAERLHSTCTQQEKNKNYHRAQINGNTRWRSLSRV